MKCSETQEEYWEAGVTEAKDEELSKEYLVRCCRELISPGYLLFVSVLNHIQPFATTWTVARQASLSVGFSRQEYWSGVPSPPPGDLHHPGMERSKSLALAGGFFLNTVPPGKPYLLISCHKSQIIYSPLGNQLTTPPRLLLCVPVVLCTCATFSRSAVIVCLMSLSPLCPNTNL